MSKRVSMKYASFFLISAAAVCISPADVKSKICWALCRTDGAHTGFYDEKEKACICGFIHDFKVFTEAVLVVPRKHKLQGNYE